MGDFHQSCLEIRAKDLRQKETLFLGRQKNSADHYSLCYYNSKLTKSVINRGKICWLKSVSDETQKIYSYISPNLYLTTELLPKLYLEIAVFTEPQHFYESFCWQIYWYFHLRVFLRHYYQGISFWMWKYSFSFRLWC
jgi:hypothetical protein